MAQGGLDKYIAECKRRLGDIIQEGFLIVDAGGCIISANAALCGMLGFAPDELQGKNFLDISARPEKFDPSLQDALSPLKLRCFNLSEQTPLNIKLFTRDGSPVPVTMRSATARDKSGEIVTAAGVFKPAGDQAHRAAKGGSRADIEPNRFWDLEQNYRNILDTSGDGILITDVNSLIVTVNEAMVRMLGYNSQQDITGRYLLDLGPVEGTFTSPTGEQIVFDKAYYESQIETSNRLFQMGHARSLLYIFHAGGQVIPIEATMSLLTDPEGRRRGTIAICRNITERLIAERRNREAKLFMENIFETARDGIYVTDGLGRTIMVNRAFCDITGYRQEELIGKTPASLLPDDADIAVSPKIIAALGNRDDMSLFETKWRRKDGTIFPVEVCLAVLTNGAGEDNGIVATVRDITERAQAQEALQRSHEMLEQKVKERTESLEDMNTALRVLLKGREEDKQTHEEKILANVNELVLPYLSRLKGTRLDERQRASIAIIEANLKDIIAPFGAKTAARNLSLTPSEIQIANLIKHGMTAKEIAGITSLSPRTIECHRASIRKKLGIKNRKVNLRVFLLSSY